MGVLKLLAQLLRSRKSFIQKLEIQKLEKMIAKVVVVVLIAAVSCSASDSLVESVVPETDQSLVAPFPPSSSLLQSQEDSTVQGTFRQCRKGVSKIAKLMGSKMKFLKMGPRHRSFICTLVCRSARTALKASRKCTKRLKGCRKKCSKKARSSIKRLSRVLCRKRKGRRSTRRKSSITRRRRRRSRSRRTGWGVRRRSGRRRRKRGSTRRRRRRW